MSNISRRSFLQRGAAAAAALTIVPGSVLGKSHGYVAPTDKLNIAAVGIGGMGNANLKNMEKTEKIVLAVSVVLNIGGDLLLIVVLHMGVLGAAVATVLSQLIAVVVCAVYLWKKYEILRIRVDDLKLQDAGMLRNMLSSGLSMGFMSSLVNIGTLTLQTSINKLGQNIIIAHTAARKISEIFMIMFSVFGQTMATYCGQNLGAGEITRIKKGVHASSFLAFLTSAFISIVMFLFGKTLLSMFISGDPEQTSQVLAIAWHFY